MQLKDIPTEPILVFIAEREEQLWCNLGFCDDRDVRNAMPEGVPYKLALRKMGQLIRKGLVEGCDCGCRGDFETTSKGREIAQKATAPARPSD